MNHKTISPRKRNGSKRRDSTADKMALHFHSCPGKIGELDLIGREKQIVSFTRKST